MSLYGEYVAYMSYTSIIIIIHNCKVGGSFPGRITAQLQCKYDATTMHYVVVDYAHMLSINVLCSGTDVATGWGRSLTV